MKIIIKILVIFVLGFNLAYAQSVWDAPVVKQVDNAPVDIVVYRSPTCGCCGKWLAHLKQYNFKVQDNVLDDVQKIKDKYGVSRSLASCHTAIVNGYVVEGHVPASDIIAMLRDKPEIKGLTVPGMVVGTPGMEMGVKKAPFKVLAFDKGGQVKLYKAYDNY